MPQNRLTPQIGVDLYNIAKKTGNKFLTFNSVFSQAILSKQPPHVAAIDITQNNAKVHALNLTLRTIDFTNIAKATHEIQKDINVVHIN